MITMVATVATLLVLTGYAPAQDASSLLQGSRPKPVTGPYLPPAPQYRVTHQHNIPVRVRDGIALATDLYLPEGVSGPLPVIYIVTPYNKDGETRWPQFLAGQGFAVAVQDVRGKYRSQGTFVVEHSHGPDGFDTIAWLAKQPWSNGRVGMFGCSYPGEVQLDIAKYRPPALHALISMANAGEGGPPRAGGMNGPRIGGALILASVLPWMRESMSKTYANAPGWPEASYEDTADRFFNLDLKVPPVDYSAVYMHLPLVTMMEAANSPPTDWVNYIQPYSDPWWKTFDVPTPADSFDVPALQVNGFYDYGVTGTIYFWHLLQERSVSAIAQRNQFLVLAPGLHCRHDLAGERLLVGERDDGDVRVDFYHLYVEWFRHWLTDQDAENTKDFSAVPKVLYYTSGENRWRGDSEWPPQHSQLSRLYLSSRGDAQTVFGHGELDTRIPGRDHPDVFTYDPAIPTPTTGGSTLVIGTNSASRGAVDQRAREVRRDVLVYSSAPLQRAVRVSGPMVLALAVSSTAPDTDFHGTVVEVFPDGRALNVTQGILRVRYRLGFDKPVTFMKPKEIYSIYIQLRDTSHVFAAGSRIRVDVASASFPEFDRNLNTGGDNITETTWQLADNSVHHSPQHPSYLEIVSAEPVDKSSFVVR